MTDRQVLDMALIMTYQYPDVGWYPQYHIAFCVAEQLIAEEDE